MGIRAGPIPAPDRLLTPAPGRQGFSPMFTRVRRVSTRRDWPDTRLVGRGGVIAGAPRTGNAIGALSRQPRGRGEPRSRTVRHCRNACPSRCNGVQFAIDQSLAPAMRAAARLRWFDRSRLRIRQCRCNRRDQQQAPAQRQPSFTLSMGQETLVANLHEALGQNMRHETPQELDGIKRHRLLLLAIGVVLVAERDPAITQFHPT
jgi:hypothetical protein